jgi:hypothetical protein
LLEVFKSSLPDDLISATIVLTPIETHAVATYANAISATARDVRIGQVTELPAMDSDLELNLEKLMRQKTRNLVRKSLRQGFNRVCTLDPWAWDFLVDVHTRNLQMIGGNPKPRSHFDALRRTLPAHWIRLSVACLGERPVAALLLVRYNRTVEYLTPVIEHDARSLQPLSFLIWNEMIDAVHDEFRWWNWGGTWTSQRSLHHFKAGWGARELPYEYVATAGPRGLERVARDFAGMAKAFPYYYLYPLSALG